MIPMLPRQSTDDDRPAGLKLTRNNFLNFPKNDNSSSLNRVPSNASTVSSTTATSSSLANVSNQQPIKTERGLHRPQYSATPRSPPSTSTSSPTLPARSPFRIRDSQQQQQQQQSSKLSHDQKSNRSNSSIDIDSSISSSSSSSIMTIEDDLTHELENLWKYKASSSTTVMGTPKDELTKAHINSEDMLLQLLISQAMIDAKDYKILKYEELETLKQHLERLKKQIQNSNIKLEIDKKIHNTSQSLTHLSANKNRESVIVLLDEAVEADRKVAILTQRLSELRAEEVNTQYQILQHTAGVLYLGLQSIEQTNLDKRLDSLHSEVETIKQTLRTIVRQYVKPDSLNTLSINELLDRLENQLARYKAQSSVLEAKLEAATENSQQKRMSEKKLEDELQATQAKRMSAETKCKELQQQIDSFMDSWSPPSAVDPSQQVDHDNDEVKQKLEAELEKAYADVTELRHTVSNLETQADKLKTQVSLYQKKEDQLKTDIDKYRTEVCQLRADKESREKSNLDQSIENEKVTITSTPGESLSNMEAQYEVQLDEQEKEYQAQLKEQAAFLDQSTRECEKLQEEYDKLSATCKDLELLIQQKQKALDARDAQIANLENEIFQHIQQQKGSSRADQLGSNNSNNEEINRLQALFSEKEAQWIEQSTMLESNFEGILKEFDRLTGTAMEFEADKLKYEKRIAELTREVEVLEASLLEQKTKSIGYEGDTPTTASLRKEFRKMINDMKAEHQRMLDNEMEEKKRLEKQLKDLKHEREMSRYERSNKGVQTLFIV